jgi:hypothetical protein
MTDHAYQTCRYVSRRDSSPLFSALRHWRGSIDRPAATASQQTLTHSRGSSWTRWWPRRGNSSSSSRTATAGGARRDTLTPKTTPSQPLPSASSASRPSIPISQTAPAEVRDFPPFAAFWMLVGQDETGGSLTFTHFKIRHPLLRRGLVPLCPLPPHYRHVVHRGLPRLTGSLSRRYV